MMLSLARRTAGRSLIARSNLPKRGYHENIVEHYENPRNVGSFENAKNDESVGTVRFERYVRREKKSIVRRGFAMMGGSFRFRNCLSCTIYLVCGNIEEVENNVPHANAFVGCGLLQKLPYDTASRVPQHKINLLLIYEVSAAPHDDSRSSFFTIALVLCIGPLHTYS
jgi:NifU-like N terminal domain